MSEAVMPVPPAQTGSWPRLASGASRWLPGLILIVLGCTVLFGWATRELVLVGVLPGFPTMVMNTALMFVASGLALVFLVLQRRLPAQMLGIAVGILSLAILCEHVFGLDLGIDYAAGHAWARDEFPFPGRTARSTALCFLLSAAALLLLCSGTKRARLRLAGLLGIAVAVISAISGFSHALGLDALYPSVAVRGMAFTTSLGLILLGATLHGASLHRESDDDMSRDADRRMVSVGTVLLVVVALVTGLPILFLVRFHIEKTIVAGLGNSLITEVQLLDTILSHGIDNAEVVTTRPLIIDALLALRRNPSDAAAPKQIERVFDSFKPHDFSALRLILPDGRTIAERGTLQVDPALIVPLGADGRHDLLWRGNYYIRSRLEFRDKDMTLGSVQLEQLLPRMGAAIIGGQQLGESGELQLCQAQDTVVRCFPSRRRPVPIEIPYSGSERLALRAVAGGSGVEEARDGSGNLAIGVYAPVATHGLFAILKVDTVELYGPLRRDLERALLTAALVVMGGSLLFRTLVKPIAAELVRAREVSQQKSRAMERLHAFQRAVFDQAPDGILVADEQGRIIEANERVAKLFGYPHDGLAGKSIEELVPSRVRGEHLHHRARFQRMPSTRSMSRDRALQGQRADGSEFPIEVALAPMSTDEGRRVIAIVKDVTEARKAEQLVRDALNEKNLLLGEIHHRVKNNLQIVHSMLDMQAVLTTDERAAGALRDSQNRIQSMALIHQTLYQSHDFAQVDFGQFLDTLISHLQSAYGLPHLQMSTDAENVRLAIDRAIPCGLIVNELVTNALKHAFPDGRNGSIRIQMRILRGVDVEVSVTDDGVGIPDSVDFSALSSLGMQLVQVLTEQLNAELNVRRRDPTRVAFTFPLQ